MGLFSKIEERVNRLKNSFSKTRESLFEKINSIIGNKKLSEDDIEKIEEILIQSDFGTDFTDKLISNIKKKINTDEKLNQEGLTTLIKEVFLDYFANNHTSNVLEATELLIIQIVGINGSGKTTTIAKLANYFVNQSKKVLIASCDTFRAAANEQLKSWATKVGVEIIEDFSKDSAAVAFEALREATSKKFDVLLIDTAGRLHTNINLMNELKKINKVVLDNVKPNCKNEVVLVVDGNSGQNAKNQLVEFTKFIPITGIIITKLDGTAKGGSVLQLAIDKNIKILFLGLGESIDDLYEFTPEEYIESIIK